MNSKRLAVFAASMQWADAVKVVSRVSNVGDLGNSVVGVFLKDKVGLAGSTRNESTLAR